MAVFPELSPRHLSLLPLVLFSLRTHPFVRLCSDQAAATELFNRGSPKFVSPVVPNYDAETRVDVSSEPLKIQLKLFLKEITQQFMIPVIRSYLKLYSTMPIEKLASFLKMVSHACACDSVRWMKGLGVRVLLSPEGP